MADENKIEQAVEVKSKASLREERSFIYHAILFFSVAALFLLGASVMWYAASVLLLVFACILMAVFLFHLTRLARKWLPLPYGMVLAMVVLLIFGLLLLGGWLMAPQVSQQASDLAAALPDALQRLRSFLSTSPVFRDLMEAQPSTEKIISQVTSMLPAAGSVFTGVVGVLGNAAIIVVVGIYLAAQPQLYIGGIVAMLPHRNRARAHQVFEELGLTLGQWLAGKFISMLSVGVVTAVGLTLLDIPLALVLGVIAGLFDFIPYVGPILAGIPAVLIAFSDSPASALYVALLFIAVQTAESYLLAPIVERKMVALPPALTIMMQVLLGSIFGLIGVALASPLTAALTVLIVMLYIQDVLGDPVKTPAEH